MRSTTIKFFVVAIVLAAGSFTSLALRAADEARLAAQNAQDGKNRFFELRVYTAAPGKMDDLNKRFRDHTLRLFEKHGIQNVGYWTAVDEKHQGKLYYLIAYPDRASRDRMLVNGIAKDPEFAKAVAESERNGKLVDGIEEVFLNPTDYSPLK